MIYDYFIYSYSFLHLRDNYELTIDQLPVGLIAQFSKSAAPGHGFDSRSSLNFFRFLLFNCLS